MKKIGLVTYLRGNYGSVLQCYATKTYIESLGYECIVLENEISNNYYDKWKKMLRLLIRSIRYPGYFSDWKTMKKSMKKELSFLTEESGKKIDTFIGKSIKIIKLKQSEFKKIGYNKEWSFFIVGSDQVWNPSRYVDDFYFLKFAPRNKRIAFAPSFGISKVPQYSKSNVINGINGIDNLSVREESGQSIIKELCGLDVPCIADPTLLLSAEEWIEFADKKLFNEEYYLIHFLNKPSDLAIKCINAMPKETKRICFAYNHDSFNQLENAIFVDGDPRDYVGLINNSKLIFTDSFHTTLFSLNLSKEFMTFERQYIHSFSQSSRIENLLSRYNLIERYIKDFNQFTVIKEKKLIRVDFKEDREKDKNYLNNVLEIRRNI